MSHQNSRSQIVKFAGWLMIGFVIVLGYNNCGQRGFQSEMSPQPVEKIRAELAQQYAEKISPNMCVDSSLYNCVHRIFSEDVDDFAVDLEFPCVKVSSQDLCVNGRQYGFNSKAAKEKCGDNCNRSYEYEEFSCYVDLQAANGTFPLAGDASNFEDALSQAHASCLQFVQGLNE